MATRELVRVNRKVNGHRGKRSVYKYTNILTLKHLRKTYVTYYGRENGLEAASLVPSANLRLRKCDRNKLQNFEWSNKNEILLISNRKLCLTVDQGQSKKGGGGSPVHLIRNLSLELCTDSLNPYQAWGVRK